MDITESYNFQNSAQNALSMDITLNNEGLENNSVLVQNYVIKRLDDGNIELIFSNNESSNDTKEIIKSTIDSANFPKQTETFEFDLDIETVSKNEEIGARSIEVPVITSHQKDSIIHHVSSQKQRTTATITQIKKSPMQMFSSRAERFLVNITIYSCFKCKEQFNSLTMFRQHLKWHKAKKNFNCTKCAAGFNAENNLKIHMVTSHPGHHTDVCPICKIKFQRKASLKSHIMVHQVEEFFTCEECHSEFQNDDELLKHMEIHAIIRVTKTLSDSLVCPYCKLDFETLTQYKEHIEKHVEVKKNVLKGKKVRKRRPRDKLGGYKCKYCQKIFSKSCLLDRHERIHTGERPYVCTFCKRAFAQKGTLQIHLGSHAGLKPYSCTLCQAKFTQKGNLRAHIEKTHTAPKGNQKMYRCTQCACIFRKVASLNGHITKVHLNQDENESTSDNIIDKVIGSLKLLNNELGKSALKKEEPKPSHHSVPKFSGTTCVRLAESHANGGVRRYIVRQRKIGEVRWYFCNFCSSRFKKPSDLIRHFRTHTLEKPYKCVRCNQAFSLKSTLINHYKIHNTRCQCAQCDSKFRNSRDFNTHVRSPEVKVSAPNYVCTLCEEVFFTMEEGKRHRIKHEGEMLSTQNIIEPILKQPLYETTYGSLPLKPPRPKIPNTGAESPLERPHHCKVCDARFARLMSLKRHMFYHTGERKFRCTLCPKAFITKYRLKEHINYHKNIRNYGCQACGKKFVTASLLKRHAIVHNNFKPYLCPYCGKNFKTSLLCRAHIKTVHKVNVYLVNGEELSKDTDKIVVLTDDLSKTTTLDTTTAANNKNTEQDPLSSTHQETVTSVEPSLVNNQPNANSVVLNVTQENQEEPNPAYQMVYLNIADLPAESTGNLLSTIKIQNESLLFNDLQDSAVLFNIDNNKSDMVDPNEVIKSMTSPDYTSTINKISDNASNLGKIGDMVIAQDEGSSKRGDNVKKEQTFQNLPGVGDLATEHQGISLQDFSAVDLEGLPISIIGAEDEPGLSTNLTNSEMNINPNDMFYDAQVICINCHKIFSDMNVFQKHVCSQNPQSNVTENLNLLLQGNGTEDVHNEMVQNKLPRQPEDASIKSTGTKIEKSQADQLDEVLESDSTLPHFDRLKTFNNKKPLMDDLKKLDRAFKCNECNFSTSIEERYRKHMNFLHAQSSSKVCKFCFKDFKKLSDLVRHLRTHTGERPYECEQCHKRFSLKSTLDSHLRTHEVSPVSKISCDVCSSNFTTKSSLKVHMLLHTGARPHACTFCEQTFRTSAIRKAHEKNMHLNKSKQSVQNKAKSGRKLLKLIAEDVGNTVKMEKVQSLDASNTTKESETSVIQSPTETIILNSSQESVAIDPVLLLQHFQNTGIILTTDNAGTVPLTLNDITLLDYETLKTNGNDNDINLLGDIENLQFTAIGESLDSTQKINNIQFVQDVTASTDKPDVVKSEQPTKRPKVVQKVECDICHKLYASKDVLRKHKKNVHGQNKKFPCIKCDKGYDSLEELNKHIVKLHTGYRPYACQYCANSFSEENSLKTHIKRIHQKSQIAQETTNALLGLQMDLPLTDNNLSSGIFNLPD